MQITKINTRGVYIIAEAGVNHNGSKDLAFSLIDAAVKSGCDAVKFQTFDAEKLALNSAPKASYQKITTDSYESQLEMLRSLELSHEFHYELQKYARERCIEFLSTPFDIGSLEFLERLDIPVLKVSSGELVNAPLLWRIARTKKPLILSTGMATLSEVEQALAVITHALHCELEPESLDDVWKSWSVAENRELLRGHIILLHCTSRYPTSIDEVNLRAMDTLANAFKLGVGYSDHTEGILVPIAAVARGALVIEKHFTLDKKMKGPDHQASLEPHELCEMVRQIRLVEKALGDGIKSPFMSEWDTRRSSRQQVVVTRDINEGEILSRADLTSARCGGGIPASQIWDIVGRRAERNYHAGEVLVW